MSIMTLFSKDDHLASWRLDQGLRHQLEGAAFELLAQLCDASQKGREAVGAAEACKECAARAIEIVGSMVGEDNCDKPASLATSDRTEDEDDSDMADEPAKMIGAVVAQNEIANVASASLCAAAMSFLSALVPLPKVRKEIVKNKHLIHSVSTAGVCNTHQGLQYEAVKLVGSLAPYATNDDTLSPELVADVLGNVLKLNVDSKGVVVGAENTNLLYGIAATGIHVIFNSLSTDKQLDLAEAVAARFSKTVKITTSARGDRAHGAQLAFKLGTLLLLARGKESTESIFSAQLMTSFVNMTQWRYDPKTKIEGPDASLWKASVTLCLQILSMTLTTTEERLVKMGIKKSDLATTVLMVARPGKAPRKAIDLPSALAKAAVGEDATSGVAAAIVKGLLI